MFVRKPLGGQSRHGLFDRVANGAPVTERTIETNRERACGLITDRTTHADDTVDNFPQRIGHSVAEACV
jgi:hypothetical protein